MRYFLIRLLAGKRAIIMNAKIEAVATEQDTPVVWRLSDGALIEGCHFIGKTGIGIRISDTRGLR